ncbi:hypothetical protein SUDANB1_05677 [Streptomyces sp. enrichment culture]|uniref:hypothetical protein n=1 Tax=Streptomyces sp. enrichment culture TaxID=1795815 RepID=UPI003F5451E6
MLQQGVCEPWGPLDMSCCSNLPEDVTDEQLAKWQMIATRVLWALSGRRVGPSCPYVVRPCRKACLDGYGWFIDRRPGADGLYPYIVDGQWYNASPCGCTSDCSCTELCEIYLPGPVYDIVSVQQGELTLPNDGTSYRVDNGNTLVRVDGGCWPDCQTMTAAPGTPGSFTVTYRVGLPLDELALNALSAYVCHLAKSCGNGGCGCRLQQSRNLSRVSRQGVDLEFGDPTTAYSELRTGIPEVDLWLTVVNPYRQTSPSRVWSPDFRRPRLMT